MDLLKKITTFCLLLFATFSFSACKNSNNPPNTNDINSMFEYYSVSTSADYTITYDSENFIEENETSITLTKNSKIKLSPCTLVFSENSTATTTIFDIAYGYNINGSLYSFEYFDNNYYYITKDTTITIYYKSISLFGVLIYQNLPTNNDYMIDSKPDILKTLVSTDNLLLSTENIFMLYYNFTNNPNTNTTFNFENSQNKNSLCLEIFAETTNISTCLIFKDNDGSLYFCNFANKSVNSDEPQVLYNLDHLKISIAKNLSYKKG